MTKSRKANRNPVLLYTGATTLLCLGAAHLFSVYQANHETAASETVATTLLHSHDFLPLADDTNSDEIRPEFEKFLRIMRESHKPILEREVTVKGINKLELEFSFDMKREHKSTFAISEMTPANKRETEALSIAHVRQSGFCTGYNRNYNEHAVNDIVSKKQPIVPTPSAIPPRLTESEKSVWLSGWDDGCRSGYRYYPKASLEPLAFSTFSKLNSLTFSIELTCY